eukprot:TRINITY_DN9533_c0_g1_i1.p1 TRINITY_DN9533_c0_g1~~TRINITY_DN9533_c0_g1_i1.p1  ORF type:complete len:341 (-),score=18.80 TRINITY_DN9533_c0_g1_i1:153-1175(-)
MSISPPDSLFRRESFQRIHAQARESPLSSMFTQPDSDESEFDEDYINDADLPDDAKEDLEHWRMSSASILALQSLNPAPKPLSSFSLSTPELPSMPIPDSSTSGSHLSSHLSLNGSSPQNASGVARMEGWTYKLGGKSGKWQKRWLILRGGAITYVKTPTSSTIKGTIDAAHVTKIALDSYPSKSNSWSLTTSKRTYYFYNSTYEEREQWINAVGRMLASVANANQMIGYLSKLSPTSGNLQRRWFVLGKSTLFYFINENSKRQRGSIPLASISEVSTSWSKKVMGFPLVLHTPKRVYVLSAPSDPERDRWVIAIRENIQVSKKARITTIYNKSVGSKIV